MDARENTESLEEIELAAPFLDTAAYKCLDCSQFFADRTQLTEHPCEYYKTRFSSRRHINSAEQVERICDSCSSRPASPSVEHICQECTNLYVENKFKITHRRLDIVKHSYPCDRCGEMYSKICDLGSRLPKRPKNRRSIIFGYTLLLTGSTMITGALIYAMGLVVRRMIKNSY